MLFKECFKIHLIEYHANQGNVFPKKSSYCKDHAIQGFVDQGPTVSDNWSLIYDKCIGTCKLLRPMGERKLQLLCYSLV